MAQVGLHGFRVGSGGNEKRSADVPEVVDTEMLDARVLEGRIGGVAVSDRSAA
jgi:hypothetical protein